MSTGSGMAAGTASATAQAPAAAGPLQWAVAVFAHNEERNLEQALASLARAIGPGLAGSGEVWILENGSRDRTAELARTICSQRDGWQVRSLPFGDKCNAWNEFVHEIRPVAQIHFFMDGDVQVDARALDELQGCLAASDLAHVAAAVPGSGRSRQATVAQMTRNHELAGNLYAVRGSFIERVRAQGIRLPQGYIGDDSLVGALAKWDLRPEEEPWTNARIQPCPQALFYYHSLSLARSGDLALYWRRRIRYSQRHFENRTVGPLLQSAGVRALPADAQQLFRDHPEQLKLRWRGLNTLFDWLALKRIREGLSLPDRPSPAEATPANSQDESRST